MPLLEIKREEPKPRLIQMGHAPKLIEPSRVCGCECGTCMFPGNTQHCTDCTSEHQRWLVATDKASNKTLVMPVHVEVAPQTIDPPVEKAMAAAVPIPDAPLEPKTQNKRREKKMAKEKDLDSTAGGPEVIRKDDAGDQGAIGTGGRNAPAQEKVPEKPAEGNKEGK